MFCNKCGDFVDENETYCNKCGNYVGDNDRKPENDNKKMMLFGVIIGILFVIIIVLAFLLFQKARNQYYFNPNSYDNNQSSEITNTTSKGKYSTVIVYDNTYSGVKISNNKDAYDLIVEDSIKQKDQCPNEIKKIEEEIINEYGVTAVNLCEMNVELAKEIKNAFKIIYEEYPGARGYITNLTLMNTTMRNGSMIAAFMPVFNFATSNSTTTYPWVIKTQILLNTSFFLNEEKLSSAVESSSKSGHFPPNATLNSPVAHELGHYLSFLAMMKDYELKSILLVDNNNVTTFYEVYDDFASGRFSFSMINEAYENYRKDTNITIDFDEWRGTISDYALAKDNSGNYIYDETIAEAFHDVYLNGDNAVDASKYVVNVLKKKLK